MAERETMLVELEENELVDFMELYETGNCVPARSGSLPSNPITPETCGFGDFTQIEIDEILEIGGF